MSQRRAASFTLSFILLLAILFPVVAHSERPIIPQETDEQLDVVLLMDSSASMQITDPDRLRVEGAKLLVQFLRLNDRLAIIEFDEEARVIRPLTSYSPLDAATVAKEIEQVGQSGRFTNLLAGIKRGRELLAEDPRPEAQKVIILLSDGKMDPNPEREDIDAPSLTAALLHYQVPELRSMGVRVHTLAFSEQADRELLKQIAQISQGVNFFAPTADDIHEAFAELFLVLKKPQIVPATGAGFRIGADVREATFYINRQEQERVALISPNRNQFTPQTKAPSIDWFEGTRFDVVTIQDPEAGVWQISGLPKNEGFATVLSNLKLLTDWPASIQAGTRVVLQARLYDDEKPVVLPEMTGVTRYAFQITPTDKVSEPIVRKLLQDNGEDGDSQKDDGIFSAYVTIDEPGEYRLRVLAKGPTFERHQAIPFRVRPRLVTLAVVPIQNGGPGSISDESGSVDYFRATLNAESAKLKRLQVQLFARGPQGYFELPLTQRADRSLSFEAPSTILPGDGTYELQAKISGEGARKDIVRGESQVIRYKKEGSDLDRGDSQISLIVKDNPQEPASPVVWAVLVVLINGGVGGYLFSRLRSASKTAEFVMPDFEPSEETSKKVDKLEKRSQLVQLDMNDPIFSDSNLGEAIIPDEDDGATSDAETVISGSVQQESEDSAPDSSEADDEEEQEVGHVIVDNEPSEEESDSEDDDRES